MRFSEKSKQAREQPVKTVRLTPKTIQDLEDIWFYGYHHFGEVQADNCINPISDFFRYYLNNSIGTPGPELSEYINALLFEWHIIHFLQTDANIIIIRILSHNQDTDRHLNWQ
jgi:toxin ParE1/3/4